MERKIYTYTNRELAQGYFSVVAQYSGDLRTYNFQKRKIAESGIDLLAFYREHRSFAELKVNGIGKKTKEILELIFEKGIEEAKKLIQENKIDTMRRSQFAGIPSIVPREDNDGDDDTSLSLDDVVKRYEED